MPDDRLARTRQGYEGYVYLPPVNLGHPRCDVVGQVIHIPLPERFRTTNWPLLDKVSANWRAVYEPTMTEEQTERLFTAVGMLIDMK